MTLPERIDTEAQLDEIMTRPRAELVEFMRGLSGPLLILGAGGKMGPTLALLARRAADAAGNPLDVIAVSRFSDAQARTWLENQGVRTISADLFDRAALERLPDSENVLYLVGLKFGTSDSPARTWAVNTIVPADVCRRFPASRIVALSSGNVYPLSPVGSSGWAEDAPLTPVGEYANSCVARERVFQYFSETQGAPVALIRLSYALDLRYGVLFDIGQKVFAGQPVDLAMGYFNGIWQGDANEAVIRALGLATSPATALNLTGDTALSVREIALRFGAIMGRTVQFVGREAETALLSDISRLKSTLGAPPTPVETVLDWTAQWIMAGGRSLGKPTHFEVRDGSY